MDGPEAGETATSAFDDDREVNGSSDGALMSDEVGKIWARSTSNVTEPPSSAKHLVEHTSGAAGRFASRLMNNVQRHLGKDQIISGTLTLSLELLEDDDQLGKLRHLQEPRPPRPPGGYSTVDFKVAEDIAAERRRRENERISVPQMLSRMAALHHRLEGLN